VSGLAAGELSFSSSAAAAVVGLRAFGDFDLGLADPLAEPVPFLGGIYSSPYKNILLILS
jgi:hypothetical protein